MYSSVRIFGRLQFAAWPSAVAGLDQVERAIASPEPWVTGKDRQPFELEPAAEVNRAIDTDVQTQKTASLAGVPRDEPPSTIGRPAVPWIVVTPEVMLSGSAEYACSIALNWKPVCQVLAARRRPHSGIQRAADTTRCRWSSSERPQSFERSKGSIGELKKNSPTLFIDFESV